MQLTFDRHEGCRAMNCCAVAFISGMGNDMGLQHIPGYKFNRKQELKKCIKEAREAGKSIAICTLNEGQTKIFKEVLKPFGFQEASPWCQRNPRHYYGAHSSVKVYTLQLYKPRTKN